MRIMSIDASSKSTGVAIFEGDNLVYYECVTARDSEALERIPKMVSRIRVLHDKFNVREIIMEDVIPQDVSNNLQVFKVLHYLQAAVVLELYPRVVSFYTASEWRKKCGIKTGRGITRDQVKKADIAFVKDKYNVEVNDDIADAICIGYAYINSKKTNSDFFM